MAAPRFRHVALTSRSEIPEKERTLQRIVRAVEGVGADISIDPDRCDVPSLQHRKRFRELKGFDLILILGGDGTILRTVRELKDVSIPLLSVNQGRVGFLAEVDAEEIETLIPELLQGRHTIEERQMLQCRVLRNEERRGLPPSLLRSFGRAGRTASGPRRSASDSGGRRGLASPPGGEASEGWETILTGHVLNEVVIHQGAIARLIDLKTSINGNPLTEYRADGIIIATPTGSTAYNLAAGGPIVHPTLEATILTPINPYAFSQKPLVIPGNHEVTVEVLPRESKFEDLTLSLTFDGQVHHALQHGDRVVVSQHPQKIRFLRRTKDTFYEAIRRKLKWGG